MCVLLFELVDFLLYVGGVVNGRGSFEIYLDDVEVARVFVGGRGAGRATC